MGQPKIWPLLELSPTYMSHSRVIEAYQSRHSERTFPFAMRVHQIAPDPACRTGALRDDYWSISILEDDLLPASFISR
jgi:hypothetical protein